MILLLAALALAAAPSPTIVTTDVDRFFQIYGAAQGHPGDADLQTYVDGGSPGLHDFTSLRALSGEAIGKAIAKNPAVYERARSCAPVLPRVRQRLSVALARLAKLYPPATFPPITILIGRNSTGGTTSPTGVLIGLEMLCSADYLEPDIESRFVHVIAHEYAHVQQPGAAVESPDFPLLFVAMIEGGAEFVGERTSGGVSYQHLRRWTKGHEAEILARFAAERTKTDTHDWLYNGPGTPDHPGDLAYWVGYRIAKAYYSRAADKKRALAEIITVTPASAETIYQASGLAPAR